jgi:hypothetical protein
VQEVIACAGDVRFRDDLAEESKADLVQLFDDTLAEEGSTIKATYAAAAHLAI